MNTLLRHFGSMLLGGVIGGTIGFFTGSLCFIAAESDRPSERHCELCEMNRLGQGQETGRR